LLSDHDSRKARTDAALALKGSLGAKAADDLAESVTRIRSTWR
jgi:hypothetical protein